MGLASEESWYRNTPYADDWPLQLALEIRQPNPSVVRMLFEACPDARGFVGGGRTFSTPREFAKHMCPKSFRSEMLVGWHEDLLAGWLEGAVDDEPGAAEGSSPSGAATSGESQSAALNTAPWVDLIADPRVGPWTHGPWPAPLGAPSLLAPPPQWTLGI